MEPEYVLKQFQPGELIITEGEVSGRLYILKSGTLEVLKDGVVIGEIVEEGSIFGEMSELLEGRRTATIRAKDQCELYMLKHTLSEIIENYPNITVKIMVSLADRLVQVEKKYCKLAEETEQLKRELESSRAKEGK